MAQALEDILNVPMWVDQATVSKAGIEAHPEQVVMEASIGFLLVRRARAALKSFKVNHEDEFPPDEEEDPE